MSRRGPLPTYLPPPHVRELISGRTSSERTFIHTIPNTSYTPPPLPPQVRELISGHTSSERNLHSRSAQHLASSEDHQRQVGDLRNGRSEDWGMGGVTIRGRVPEEAAEACRLREVDDLPSRPVLTRRVERTGIRPVRQPGSQVLVLTPVPRLMQALQLHEIDDLPYRPFPHTQCRHCSCGCLFARPRARLRRPV